MGYELDGVPGFVPRLLRDAGAPRRQPDPALASCYRLIRTRVCQFVRTSSVHGAFAQVDGHLGLAG